MTKLFGAGDGRPGRLRGLGAALGPTLSAAIASRAQAEGLAGAAGGGWRANVEALVGGDLSVLSRPAVAGGIAAAVLALVLLLALALRGGEKKTPKTAPAAASRAPSIPAQRAAASVSQPTTARAATARPTSAAPRTPEGTAPIALPVRSSRKLNTEIELKLRDGAWPFEAVGGPIKLVRERVGVVAHTHKRKLSSEPESVKRRPTPIPPGRRSASFRSPSP
jgi:hypothetical protein